MRKCQQLMLKPHDSPKKLSRIYAAQKHFENIFQDAKEHLQFVFLNHSKKLQIFHFPDIPLAFITPAGGLCMACRQRNQQQQQPSKIG